MEGLVKVASPEGVEGDVEPGSLKETMVQIREKPGVERFKFHRIRPSLTPLA